MAKNETSGTPEKRPPWYAVFLRCLASTGNVSAACEVANVGRTTAYRHRNEDSSFADEWLDALDVSTDELEAEARRRAMGGSDTLLIFLLKGNRPEKYRDKFDVNELVRAIRESRPSQSAGRRPKGR